MFWLRPTPRRCTVHRKQFCVEFLERLQLVCCLNHTPTTCLEGIHMRSPCSITPMFLFLVVSSIVTPLGRLAAEEVATEQTVKRGYGPEQAAGEPDVPEAGDSVNAWASLGADDRKEWLVCEYMNAVEARNVHVYENYAPGALYKVTAFNEKDEELLAWEGEDPTPRDKSKGISVIPIKLDFAVRKIKLYLDSPAVPDWNEIDAVGVEDTDGEKHWAMKVTSSTTYANLSTPTASNGNRSWGPEQVKGEPDTPAAGDFTTAWASATADGQKEWLICEYETAQRTAEVVVHETYNPGAVYKITVFDKDDKEEVAWEGEDPTPRDQPRGVSVFPIKMDFDFKRIKIYIDSPAVQGWNEIDAVGLRDAKDKTQWAKNVFASTTYAQQTVPQPVFINNQDFTALQQEVQQLKEQVKELSGLRKEIKELKELLKERTNR